MHDNTQSHPIDTTEAETIAGRIIARFGGLTATGKALGVPVPTVQGWQKRGVIPQKRFAAVIKAGAALVPPITLGDLVEAPAEE